MTNDTKKRPATFRLKEETFNKLTELQEVENPIYQGRSRTWLIEFAVSELNRRVIQANSNGN